MFTVEFQGDDLKRIQKDLKKLTAREGRKVVRDANAAGIREMKKAIRDNAPVRTGPDVQGIGKGAKYGTKEPGYLKRNIGFKKMRSPNGLTVHRILFKKYSFYANFLERGTVNMDPHPFIIRAFDQTTRKSAKAVIKKLNNGLDRVLK